MSDPNKPDPKTSTVPLKKETVRIALKTNPGEMTSDTAPVPPPPPRPSLAPPAPVPTAPKPISPPSLSGAPVPRPVPTAPKPMPPVGAKTIPLAKPPTSRPAPVAPAKTAQLTPSPKPPTGARTIPLARAPGSPAPGGSPGARPLPKATVKLQKTQPMTKGAPTAALRPPSHAKTLGGDEEFEEYSYEEYEEEAGLMPFAIIVLVLAAVVLVIELLPKFAI